ncbi:MAG TPA: hypothetical protein VJG83_02520 [archaeon]|nr:hypothetical protein [archaeon]
MIGALLSGLEILKRPQLLLIALLGSIANSFILLLSVDYYFSFFYEVFVLGEIADSSIIDMPFYLLATYATEILVIVLTIIASLMVWLYVLYAYSAMLSQKKKVIQALSFAISKTPEIAIVSSFLLALSFLFAAILFFFFIATFSFAGFEIVALLILIAALGLGAYIYLKLSFTPLFMALGKKTLKQSLGLSWKLSAKHLLQIAVFLILLSTISGVIAGVFSLLSEYPENEIIAFVLLLAGIAFSSAYYNIGFIRYFEQLQE